MATDIPLVDLPRQGGLNPLVFTDLSAAASTLPTHECEIVPFLILAVRNIGTSGTATFKLQAQATEHETGAPGSPTQARVSHPLSAGQMIILGPYQPRLDGVADGNNRLQFWQQTGATGDSALEIVPLNPRPGTTDNT